MVEISFAFLVFKNISQLLATLQFYLIIESIKWVQNALKKFEIRF